MYTVTVITTMLRALLLRKQVYARKQFKCRLRVTAVRKTWEGVGPFTPPSLPPPQVAG